MVDWKRHWKNFYTLHWGQIIQDFISWRHYNHDAYIEDLSYDEEIEAFRLDMTSIKMRDMDPHALPVTGEKYSGFRTNLEAPHRTKIRKEIDENGEEVEYLNPSAISYYLYMVNNDINDSCTAPLRRFTLNPKIVIILVAVALGLLGYWFFLGH